MKRLIGSRSNSPSKPKINPKFGMEFSLKDVLPIEKEVKQKYEDFSSSFEQNCNIIAVNA